MQETIFLHYSQSELDRAYDQRVWAPNAVEIMTRYQERSKHIRARGCQEIAYGTGPNETLDLFAAAPGSPVHLHVHGGAWRMQSKHDCAFMAPVMTEAGMTFVVPDFTNLPAVRMPTMIDQLVRAVLALYRLAPAYGADASRILLSGHSSGAHLAAVLLTLDWRAHGLPHNPFSSALLVSGLYDLEPVTLSSRRDYVDLTEEEILAFSPIRHLDAITCPVTIMRGEKESPEFIRQSDSFHHAILAAGKTSDLIVLSGLNHFEMNEEFGRTDSMVAEIARRQLAMMTQGDRLARKSTTRQPLGTTGS